MISLPLSPERGARLLLLASRHVSTSAEPRVLRAKETPLHRAADAHVAKLSVALRHAFAMGRRALGKGNADAAAKAVEQALKATLLPTLTKVLMAGGEVGATMLAKLRVAEGSMSYLSYDLGRRISVDELRDLADKPLKFRFDAKNPDAVKWAKQHAAELITQIADTTRERIKAAVARQQETGEESFDEIAAAVGDEDRAEMIARHESMQAASEGQRQAWGQAVEEGLLPEDATRVWIVTGDDKLCPICEDLDGKSAALGEEYEPGIEGPPAHVNCRCTEGITG